MKTLRTIFLVFTVVMFGRTAFADYHYVPSGSMEPTIMTGDLVIETKFDYGYSLASLPFFTLPVSSRIFASTPKRGDVISFKFPKNRNQIFLKRIVGLPGDKIYGKVVPENKLFVMGDNRNNSLDSRYWGYVDLNDVVGTVKLIVPTHKVF